MKKFISFILAFAVILSISACSKSTSSKQDAVLDKQSSLGEIEDSEFHWPQSDIASLIPEPKSKIGHIDMDMAETLIVSVADTSKEDCNAYISACIDSGFTENSTRLDANFVGYNSDGYQLSIMHIEDDVMYISINGFNLEDKSLDIPQETISSSFTSSEDVAESSSAQEETEKSQQKFEDDGNSSADTKAYPAGQKPDISEKTDKPAEKPKETVNLPQDQNSNNNNNNSSGSAESKPENPPEKAVAPTPESSTPPENTDTSNQQNGNSSADNSMEEGPKHEYKDGYLIADFSYLRESLPGVDAKDVYLAGNISQVNEYLLTVTDSEGHDWTVDTGTAVDFSGYVGAYCEVYGGCVGGISSRYKTPLIFFNSLGDDDDYHIVFSDGKALYPHDVDSLKQFPSRFATNNNSGGEMMVWIPTKGGTKYHSKSSCSGMINPEEVTESTAIARGFSRCGKCW